VFPRLEADGFTLARPKGDWSCHSGNGHNDGGTRIDHALATPGLRMSEARYVYKAGRHLLAGAANGTDPLSDHAVLSVRVERPARRTASMPASRLNPPGSQAAT
jgi:hypothetical protein